MKEGLEEGSGCPLEGRGGVGEVRGSERIETARATLAVCTPDRPEASIQFCSDLNRGKKGRESGLLKGVQGRLMRRG
jgi:hypothetical protein